MAPMCGIAGYVGQGNREILERMTNTLTHRGPDDAGFFVPPSAGSPDSVWVIHGNVGLGHRRLSIIDLSPLGHQPMHSGDGKISLVFNGEIYNFQSLRSELQKMGYSFKSASDTEVIIAAYQAYGVQCFKKLNGMFAIGLYDAENNALILARDRLGKKPLYWSTSGDTLVFGSELKALLAHPAVKKNIDPLSLQKYFAFDYIPTPHTIFSGIFKLEPGHWLRYEKGEVRDERFWDIRFDADAEGKRLGESGSEKELLTALDARLDAAVASRLVSDVPLGIFLSGGLDSSTIAYYAQKHSAKQIKTFSIGFEDKSFDESPYARRVARALHTDHYEKILSAQDSLEIIPHIAHYLDEPMADYSMIPTYLLSKFTKEHVTVALGGDGGDELFFGYPTFTAERVMQIADRVPGLMNALLPFAKKIAPKSHAHFHLGFKLDRLIAGMNTPIAYRHYAWMGTFGETERQLLLSREVGSVNVFEDIDQYMSHEQMRKENRWNQLAYLYLRTYLMDQVLVKVDRASMAASLEVRAPFLDYEFVDFVNAIPYHQKVRFFQTKYLLKELMKDTLPREIVYRKKQGFGVPLSGWFANELKDFVHDTLSPERLSKHGLFDQTFIETLICEHITMKEDHRKKLWSLIVFQLWWEKWGR